MGAPAALGRQPGQGDDVKVSDQMTAKEYRSMLLLAFCTGLPTYIGMVSPVLLIFPVLIVIISTTARVTTVNAARRRRELE